MSDPLLQSAKPSLAYAKLVATPTDSSWSQAYNAGSLFACLSLTKEQAVEDEEIDPDTIAQDTEHVSLHAVGKNLLNILESEFFTLEEKTIDTVKKAIVTSIDQLPSSVSVNLSLALFKDAVLTVFIAGEGKILMKRGGHIGTLLESNEEVKHVLSASGLLSNNDTVILETGQFAHDITDETLTSALDLALPNDIAEALSPQIHKQDDGGQAAIIVVYHGITHEVDTETETLAQAIAEEENDEKETKHEELDELYAPEEEDPFQAPKIAHKHLSPKLPHIRMPQLNFHLSHKRKLFLSVAILLVALLVASIFFTRQKSMQSKQQQLFATIYDPAKKSYEEGIELKSLNKSLSRDDFLKAEKLLKENVGNFTEESSEKKQLTDLLTKVEAELEQPKEETKVDRKDLKIAVLNGSGTPGAAKGTSTHLEELGYVITKVDNADGFEYKGLTIKIKKNKSDAYLPLLRKDLAEDSKAEITTKVDDTIETDAEVIVGK
jgi:hypothetical protein